MFVQIRPDDKIGSRPEVGPTVGRVIEAIGTVSDGPPVTRIVCDWIQYRNNFRDVVDARPVLDSSEPDARIGKRELAVDLRRAVDVDISAQVAAALSGADANRLYLEPWVSGKDSCIWAFNGLYWRALSLWEEATGKRYEQALPGGASDALNARAAEDLITDLFSVWDKLAADSALPEEIYVIELGVGNGGQARTWLDAFLRVEQGRGGDYYRRLRYIMGDYSGHVLSHATVAVAEHEQCVSSIVLDATAPLTTLGFLRGKAFLVYVSNVYDNLPTDEVASIAGHAYRVEVRAYVADAEARAIAEALDLEPQAVPALVLRLLKLGPELLAEASPDRFGTTAAAVEFWRAAWSAIRLEERYVPLGGLDLYEVAPGVTGEPLRPILEDGHDVRMQVSNGAAASFVETLALLHPYGRLHCHDIFASDPGRYDTNFCGPGKYDGSVVNWVNGALLTHVGQRHGFDVVFRPFAYRQKSNVTTLSVEMRD